MSNKIFVSYKYWDPTVYQDQTLDQITDPYPSFSGLLIPTSKITPRSYLNALEKVLEEYAIQKWEDDTTDLSQFKDETIRSKLKDKIYDSSITIVLVSPSMKNFSQLECNQWIPWEISYSLRNIPRNGRISLPNAMIAIVLPDLNNSYNYCIQEDINCNSVALDFKSRFEILGKNFFNIKNPTKKFCKIWGKDHFLDNRDAHYFAYAKWNDFVVNPNSYINVALKHSENLTNYVIHSEI